MGTPPIGRYCLGVSPPNRMPRPAATTIAPTSRGKCAYQLIHVVQPHQRRAGNLHGAAGRAEHPAEAQSHRLGDAALDRPAGPDLSTETDFTEEDYIGRSGPVVDA